MSLVDSADSAVVWCYYFVAVFGFFPAAVLSFASFCFPFSLTQYLLEAQLFSSVVDLSLWQ